MGIKRVMTKINKRLKVNGAQKKKIYNELLWKMEYGKV